MSCENFILFAAPGVQEIFSILVAIVFFIVWLVNQISDAKKQQREKEQAQPEVPPDPMAAGAAPAAAQPKAPQQDPLRAQVDEFLRRAGKQPGGKPPAAASQRKPPVREDIVVLLDDSVAQPPRRSPSSLRPQPKPAPAERDKRSPAPSAKKPRAGRQRGKSVAEHVAEHTGASTTQFRQEVADLGQRVKQADEQFDRQLQQKFDHELGTLASRAPVSEPATPAATSVNPAAQIAALMASPEGVRQAIVLNEVLRRPTDRW
jgi:hypothetical protein